VRVTMVSRVSVSDYGERVSASDYGEEGKYVGKFQMLKLVPLLPFRSLY